MTSAPAPGQVELSRPGKVLFPGDGITKGDLAGYYRQAGARMLPHLRGRPLALARFPDGITGQRIFQKNVSPHSPDWLPRTEVGKQGGTVCQVIADNEATLGYLADQALGRGGPGQTAGAYVECVVRGGFVIGEFVIRNPR